MVSGLLQNKNKLLRFANSSCRTFSGNRRVQETVTPRNNKGNGYKRSVLVESQNVCVDYKGVGVARTPSTATPKELISIKQVVVAWCVLEQKRATASTFQDKSK